MKEATMSRREKSVRVMFTFFVVMALFAMASPAAYAEVTVTEEWVARYNGPANSADIAWAMATDNAGNVYVTGYSYGNGTYLDYATVAYDSSGNRLWAARYDGPANGYDYAQAIATDNAGNVYVTGHSDGNGADFDYADYATVAYDRSGNQLWVARYNGPANGYDYAQAIATDNAGNVYVTGRSQGIRTGWDYATIAYDSSGNRLWVARYDGPAHYFDSANAIAVDNAGNVYVAGHSNGNGADFDYATVAYDRSGNQLWVARYDGPANSDDVAKAIATDSAGNVYVTGGSNGDYATVAYDSLGNELWVARYDNPANSGEAANAIATDDEGNVYVTGISLNSNWIDSDYFTFAYDSLGNELWVARYDGPANLSSDPNAIAVDNAGNVYVTGYNVGNGTNYDYATVAYDSSGNQLWLARYDGRGNYRDQARAIATDSAGNVYVTGQSWGDGTGLDYATIKYSQAGPGDPIDLIDYYLEQGLIDPRMATSLKKQAANGAYGAFINHVEAQSGKKIDPDAAAILIKAARRMAAGN